MLELYNAAHSTCSQKVRMCMHEKGLSWKEHLLDLGRKEQLDPQYLELNPNGVVPTLVHDGAVITDSSVICEYIEEVFPHPHLSPDTPVARAKMRAWMRYLEEVPTVAVRVPSFNMAFLPRFEGQDDDTFLKTEAGPRPLRKYFFSKMGRGGFDVQEINDSFEQIRQTVERMADAVKTSGGPWLMGPSITLIDIIVAPLIDRMNDLGHSNLWSDLEPVVSWYRLIQRRTSFQKTFYKYARISEFLCLSPLITE